MCWHCLSYTVIALHYRGFCYASIEGFLMSTARSDRAEQLEILYDLTSQMARGGPPEQVFDAAMDTLFRSMHCERAAILLFDAEDVIRFVAARGLSDAYRRAVEGHSPWSRDTVDAKPIVVPDVSLDEDLRDYRETILREGIRALVFIPLMNEQQVIGKFMVYYDVPRVVSADELRLAETIARHVAFALERSRANQRLVEAEHRFRQLALHAPVGIFQTDARGDCLFVNERWCEIAGRSSAQAAHRGWVEAIHPDDRERVFAEWYHAAAEGREFTADYRFRTPDGRVTWVAGGAAPLKGPDGDVVQYLGTITDITESVLAERRKDEFLATLAHELRNPLAAIRSGLHVLTTDTASAMQVGRARAVLQRQVQQMTRLVDDLLDVARITQGKITLQKQRVNLGSVITDAVEASRPLFEAAGQTLTVTLPASPMEVDGDPTRLTQVLWNLLANAAKFTPAGRPIWLTAEREGSEAVVTVRDTGAGISAEQLPRIFEMFSQVAPPTTHRQSGLGIGLALARGIVHLHGGHIEGSSEGVGRGSEFIVRLPLMHEPEVTLEASGGFAEKSTRSEPRTSSRILIVDDHADNADMLDAMLQLEGHETRVVRDGGSALEAAAAFRPRIVLLDIGLPDMSGYQVAQWIRRQPWGSSTVLVALTGWGQAEDKRRSQEAGFDVHLTKPVRPELLSKLLLDVGLPG